MQREWSHTLIQILQGMLTMQLTEGGMNHYMNHYVMPMAIIFRGQKPLCKTEYDEANMIKKSQDRYMFWNTTNFGI